MLGFVVQLNYTEFGGRVLLVSSSGWSIRRYISSCFPELEVPVSMDMYHVDVKHPSQAIENLKTHGST